MSALDLFMLGPAIILGVALSGGVAAGVLRYLRHRNDWRLSVRPANQASADERGYVGVIELSRAPLSREEVEALGAAIDEAGKLGEKARTE